MENQTRDDDAKQQQKQRRQKKRLYKAICEQMEFYFSDPNLRKDKFLSKLINAHEEGYVDAEVFLKFNKIRALTSYVDDIVKAVKTSNMLKLSEDKKMIKRVTPVVEKPDVDECTIYVENVPAHADHEWLKSMFSAYGVVVYISLPRWSSGKPKGFAFVEFDTHDAARRACEHFGCISAISGRSQYQQQDLQGSVVAPGTKRKSVEEHCNDKSAKRQKLEANEEAPKSGAEENESGDEHNNTKANAAEGCGKDDDTQQCEAKGKKKKKRKRKKKKKVEAEQEIEAINLRVMHKSDWCKYRNKYLSLKKDMMSRIKKTLSLYKDDPLHSHKPNYEAEAPPTEPTSTKKNTLEFIPDTILQITTKKPITDITKFKQNVRSLGNVAYVDVTEGESLAHVRCVNAHSALEVQDVLGKAGEWNVALLKGEEERLYWEKVLKNREAKLNAKTRHKRQGFQKVLLKAKKVVEAQNKHIHF